MKLYKKSQETIGKHVLLYGIVLLIAALVLAYFIWQSKDYIYALIDRISGG